MSQSQPPSPQNSPTESKSWLRLLARLRKTFLEPLQPPADAEARSTARLISGLLLIFSLAQVIWYLIDVPRRWLIVPLFILAILTYWLGRTRHYKVAGWALITYMLVPSYVELWMRPDQNHPDILVARFAWAAFAILLAGVLFSPRAMVVLCVAQITAMTLAVMAMPGMDLANLYLAVAFLVVLTIILTVTFSQRDAVELGRRQKAHNRERRINQVIQETHSALVDMPVVLDSVLDLAVELMQAEIAFLSLVSPDGERMESVHVHNVPEDPALQNPPKDVGLAWEIIQNRRSVYVSDYAGHPRAIPAMQAAGIRAYMGVPVMAGETCLGALAVATRQEDIKFSALDLDQLEGVANQAGIAIQNARLYAKLQDELAERERIEAAMRKREAILEAMASDTGQFLKTLDWHRYIQTVLSELGQATHSSHAYIFQNHPGPDGTQVTSQLYQWSAPDIPSTLGHKAFINVPLEGPGLERWRETMIHGEPFTGCVSTFGPQEKQYLAPIGAECILEMPVYIQSEFDEETGEPGVEWWGLIGFDDYREEREWQPVEIDAIKIAAGLISTVIQRQRSDEARREREDIYRRAIRSADAVAYSQEYYPTSRFVFMGENIQELTGYTDKEMTMELWNSRVVDAVPRGEAEGLSEEEAMVLSRSGQIMEWRCDYYFRHRDGSMHWFADTSIELIGPDGHSHGSIGILQDITDRIQAEEAALQANLLLEKRVNERTAELQAANKEMEAFAYSVSHDLRAPLRAVDGYSRILQEDYFGKLDEDGQVCLENIRLATHKMNQLIDDLLQLSRVTRAEINLTQVDLSALAEELLEARHELEPERHVDFTVQPGMQAVGDLNLVRIALGNLIDNAWKFSSQADPARIEIGRVPGSEPPAFFIRDNGAGFDMRYAEKLFQAFQRLHGADEFEGAGVGLAIVHHIIRRHNGNIRGQGEVGRGATFTFTLSNGERSPHSN